jgi:hypothetical protein
MTTAALRSIAGAALLVAALGCRTATEPAGADDAARVVLVNSRFVDTRSGDVLRLVAGADSDAMALPIAGEPGHYELGRLVVSVFDGCAIQPSRSELRFEGDDLVRSDVSDTTIWRAHLATTGRRERGNEAVVSNDAVVAVDGIDVLGLDRATGDPRWRSMGLLLAGSPARLVAHDTHVAVNGGSFLYVLDGAGRVGAAIEDEEILGVAPIGPDWLVATDRRIARLGSRGRTAWEVAPPFALSPLLSTVGFVALPDGGLVAYGYMAFGDSGVGVVRVSGDEGREMWRRVVDPLFVEHSEYTHRAYAVLLGSELIVVSQGSGGSFVEAVSLESGATLRRWRYAPR